MLAELFKHVIEKRMAGRDDRVGYAIEIDCNAHLRFARRAFDLRAASGIAERVGNRDPVKAIRCNQESTHTEVAGKFEIGLAIANHRAARQVDAAIAQIVQCHADAWLARRHAVLRPVFMRKTWIDQQFAKGYSL